MKPQVQSIRAISSLYAQSVIKPLLLWAVGLFTALNVGLLVLVIKVSLWWLLLLIPILFVSVVVALLGMVVLYIAQRIAPIMNAQQRTAAKEYVNNMGEVADGLQTPQFVIVFRVVRDVLMRKGDNGFLYNMSVNTARLKGDFAALVRLFS